MAERPYTDAELEAGARALHHHLDRHGTAGLVVDDLRAAVVGAVLDAVLPDHDARVRADERARVAEEIAVHFDRRAGYAQGAIVYAWRESARLARQHATQPTTQPTTEGDHHAE